MSRPAEVEGLLREAAPESPVGWLVHVASRRMVDRVRSESARRRREELAAAQELPEQRYLLTRAARVRLSSAGGGS